jgi:general secretion pathway protein M
LVDAADGNKFRETLMPNFSERFSALSPRGQLGLRWGGGVVALALLIGAGVLPAVRSLKANPLAQQLANAQLQSLRSLQVRAQALQAKPQLDQAEAINKLQASVSLLGGNTSISIGDQQTTLELRATPAKALAEWLVRARTEAHAVPVNAQLTRETQAGEVLWSGTLALTLPPR